MILVLKEKLIQKIYHKTLSDNIEELWEEITKKVEKLMEYRQIILKRTEKIVKMIFGEKIDVRVFGSC